MDSIDSSLDKWMPCRIIDSSLETGMPCRISVNEGFVSRGQVLGEIRRSNLSFLQVVGGGGCK